MSIPKDFNFYQKIRRKKIIYFWIVPILYCNLECKMCSIWKHANKTELDLDILVENVLSSFVLNEATFVLEGGEFFLYRRYEDLLARLKNRDYIIFTNCTFPEKVISACRNYNISRLLIPLDGSPKKNRLLRKGSDIRDIKKVIMGVKDKTEVIVNYTVSQFNCLDDFKWVFQFTKVHGVKLDINVYNRLDYLFSEHPERPIYYADDLIRDPFIKYYKRWLTRDIRIPCFNIRYISSVYPNGNISLCKKKSNVILGNVYEKNFDAIWNSENTKILQRKYAKCNDCWLKCQKRFDFYFYYRYGKFLPKRIKDAIFS